MDHQVLVSVCVCTYKRSDLLRACLEKLVAQQPRFLYEVIVVDNDVLQSAKPTILAVQSIFKERGVRLRYLVEPTQNISLARNLSVAAATGLYVAFIDDDEYPADGWLMKLCATAVDYHVTAVFGPVVPEYQQGFPLCMQSAVLFNRRRMFTGTEVKRGFRTGNALVRRQALMWRKGPFREEYGTAGGEDWEFFHWLTKRGAKFCWCDEAIVYEVQERERAELAWHLRRGYSAGWIYTRCLCEERDRWVSVAYVLLRLPASSVKAVVRTVLLANKPRAACVFFLREMAKIVGKLSYFIGAGGTKYSNYTS